MEIERPVSRQIMPSNARLVFKGVVFEVYQWEVTGYDGQKRVFEKLKRPDTVVVFPVTKEGKIVVARQEQPGREPFWGVEGGRINEGEEPLAAAQRELKEETGYTSDNWQFWFGYQPVTKIDWAVYVFIAKNCQRAGQQELDGAEKIKSTEVDFEEFMNMISSGQLGSNQLRTKVLQSRLDSSKMEELRKLFLN
ncbi:MAG: NUDIX hydrolase [Patescibacteria group bacterium]